MATISRAQAQGLFELLRDSNPTARTAALRALVRLPLSNDARSEVSSVIFELLGGIAGASIDAPFEARTVEDIPQREIIQAATLVPSSLVRERLYALLPARDEETRRATALALARARDVTAIAPLIDDLLDARVEIRLQAAKPLSFLDVSPRREEVRTAFQRESDGDVQFWLALALARIGATEEIERVLIELARGERYLREYFGDPTRLTAELRARAPFPDSARAVFDRIRQETDDQIAADLSLAGEPPLESAPPIRPRDLDIAARAREIVENIRLRLPYAMPWSQLYADRDVLEHLDPDLATAFVTELFGAASQTRDFVSNDIVRLIHSLRHSFAPEISKLAEIYLGATDLQELQWHVQEFQWHIAWTISRAELARVLDELAPFLRAPADTRRIAIAQLIEFVTRYAQQSFPPLFGGGEPPPDIAPPPDLGREQPQEGGGTRSPSKTPPPSIGKIPGYIFADIEDTHRPSRSTREEAEPAAAAEEPAAAPPFDEEGNAPEGTIQRGNGGADSAPIAAEDIPANGGTRPTARRARKSRTPKSARARVVNTGFAPKDQPGEPIKKTMPLQSGKPFYFWVEIGKARRESIEVTPEEIPPAPVGARLTVALFGFKNELKIMHGADVGALKIEPDGSVTVDDQPLGEAAPKLRLAKKRLFFPVRAPRRAGVFRMRCNIYWGHLLLQSRVISARVMVRPRRVTHGDKPLRSILDYTLARTLNPTHIAKLPAHDLSILLNRNGDGTHSFHVYGAIDGKTIKAEDVRFGEGELQGMIKQARGTLRIASWGNANEWTEGAAYRYDDGQRNLARLKQDLTNLAKWGYEFYTQIMSRLAGKDTVENLEQLIAAPKSIQLAMKESPTYVLPAALIYDYRLDTGARAYSLCPTFEDAFNRQLPLENTACFQGNCPSRGQLATICPSGFWGYRHYLGVPLSTENAPDAPFEIPFQDELRLAVSVATDLQFLPEHMHTLQSLRANLGWHYADTRDEVFDILKKSAPHIVYFYCHGGIVRDQPFLQVGPKEDPGLIQRSNLIAYEIVWNAPRPLVFLNGCHTTAVEPQQALEFISPLVAYSHSAGVIGTEITIFENLAKPFAEECFRRFFAGASIGAAIRGARLELLGQGNPLGLAYIPFIMAGVTLKDESIQARARRELPLSEPTGEGEVIVRENEVIVGGVRLDRHARTDPGSTPPR